MYTRDRINFCILSHSCISILFTGGLNVLARPDDLMSNLVASSEVKVIELGRCNFLPVKDILVIGYFVFARFNKVY